jgi:hypothetical protein
MVAVLPAASASADPIVYSQPTVTPVPSVRTSQDQPGGGIEFQTFDSFSFLTATSVTGIDWQGAYLNPFVLNGAFAPPANSSAFVVEFHADASGPGAVLASQSFSPAAANETFVRQEPFALDPNLGLAIYNYSVSWAPSFVAAAGTTYWLSVYAISPTPSPEQAQWGWVGGMGGNGAFQLPPPPPLGNPVNFDRAFDLQGVGAATPVPEPSTLLLLGTAALGLAAGSRRRRQR